MNKKQFYETYCIHCGSQRCEGIDTDWGEGCQYRWNLDGIDAAAEVKRLNDKVMELANIIMKLQNQGMWKVIDNNEYGIEVQCSNCQHKAFFSNTLTAKFCPNCGADMRGAHKDAKTT